MYHRRVQLSLLKLVKQPLAHHGRTVQHDLRVLILERLQRRGDGRLGEQRDAHPDQADLAAPDRARRGDGVLEVGKQAAAAVQQFRAGLGELDAAPGPVQELHAEFSLEPRDGLR